MDNRLKEIAENYDEMKIGLDDEFRFRCTMCGKCCRNRHDILLNPYDLFRLSVGLDMKPLEICKRYCHVYAGETSRIPIVRLLPVGVDERCPFLLGNRCSVNSFKPNVCALFPLGRAIRCSADSAESSSADKLRGQTKDSYCSAMACRCEHSGGRLNFSQVESSDCRCIIKDDRFGKVVGFATHGEGSGVCL